MKKIEKAKAVIREWLHFKKGEDVILDIILGTISGNIVGKFIIPIWLFIIGPSGSGKTELLYSIKDHSSVYFISNFTPNSFVSGYSKRGKKASTGEFSLLPKIDNKIMVIKDFTTILSLHRDVRREIFGILRDAFDGQYAKSFGSEAGILNFISNFGIIAGCTPSIEKYHSIDNDLGERFLQFRLKTDTTLDMVFQALDGSTSEEKMRKEISDAMLPCLDIPIPEQAEGIQFENEGIKNKLCILADIGAKLRNRVSRDGYDKTLDFLPEPEIGTRLVKQLSKLLYGIALIREKDKITDDEYSLAVRIIHDGLGSKHAKVLSYISAHSEKTEYIAQDTKIPYATVRLVLEDLQLLNIVTKNSDNWKIIDHFKEALETTKLADYLIVQYETNF